MRAEIGTSQTDLTNAVLSACTEASRAALAEKGTVRQFEPEEPLFEEGEAGGVVLFPISGSLQLSKTAERGRRQVLCHLTPEGCGGVCVLTMADNSLADVIGITPGEVLVLSRADYQALAHADPVLCQSGWQAAVQCMSHFSSLVEHLSFRKVGERVALLLLENTKMDGDLVRLTQADLAAEVGTTREVVARCLASLQASGGVRLGRARITVMSRAKLEQQLG
jgi:CRP-like cAMP-binding protein